MGASPEAWLRGPIEGVPAALMPVAHALVQARDDIDAVLTTLAPDDVWRRPGGAAPPGFHLLHLAGALDRLLAYARAEALGEAARAQLAEERRGGDPARTVPALRALVHASLDRALAQVSATPDASLGETRAVGRAGLQATVLGLLFHAAEHTTRHVGQLVTTIKALGPPSTGSS